MINYDLGNDGDEFVHRRPSEIRLARRLSTGTQGAVHAPHLEVGPIAKAAFVERQSLRGVDFCATWPMIALPRQLMAHKAKTVSHRVPNLVQRRRLPSTNRSRLRLALLSKKLTNFPVHSTYVYGPTISPTVDFESGGNCVQSYE